MEEKTIKTKKPNVDSWSPETGDVIFTSTKGIIIAPVAESLGLSADYQALNYFIMNTKKCYNSQVMRDHTCLYLNYFEKFYDPDKELLINMCRIKYMIDTTQQYDENAFINDLRVYYIMNERLRRKAIQMIEDNYSLNLQYKNISENLQYTDDHAKVMLCMSLYMNFVIPLTTHFMHIHTIRGIDDFIMKVFDNILYMFPNIDIYSKLYETTISNVSKSETKNAPIWGKQDIRGKNVETHSYASVLNIILNIMPKYTFDRSIISLNFTSIAKNTSCQILDIEYEFNYISLSSSKRDEDNVSDFDKFETNLIKQDESLYIQAKMNSEETMHRINTLYGPFDPWMIEFYEERLKNDKGVIINSFQRQIIFNMFFKEFGDTQSIYGINSEDYIKLMLAAKRILIQNKMILLPYIISGKVDKLVGRKSVNKKELVKLQNSSYYPLIMEKYHNEKILKIILGMVATIISSDFSIIDFDHPNIDGQKIETIPEIVIEEVLAYTLLV